MLFDIDKDSDDRGTPMPNSHDKLIGGAIRAAGTTSENHLITQPTAQSSQLKSSFGRLIQTNSVQVINNGGTLTTTSIAHNLNYVPIMIAAVNNVIVTGIIEDVSLFLPTFLNASVGGVVSGAVTFGAYLAAYVSGDFMYFQLFNATGSPITVTVTYYLYQQAAVTTEG